MGNSRGKERYPWAVVAISVRHTARGPGGGEEALKLAQCQRLHVERGAYDIMQERATFKCPGCGRDKKVKDAYNVLKNHWNQTVANLAYNVLKLFMEMDQALFDEVKNEHEVTQDQKEKRKAETEAEWESLLKEAAAMDAAGNHK